jgi:putative transposase
VLFGYLARYLLTARGGLAPRYAHAHRTGAPGLVIHADRGSQYTNLACWTRIEEAQALASYSQPGTPYDNAQAKAG